MSRDARWTPELLLAAFQLEEARREMVAADERFMDALVRFGRLVEQARARPELRVVGDDDVTAS